MVVKSVSGPNCMVNRFMREPGRVRQVSLEWLR